MTTSELTPNTKFKKSDFPFYNRYRRCKVFTDKGETFFGTFDHIKIPKSTSDRYHQIKPGEECRWDLISYNMYDGVVDYWWLICLANEIYDPFTIIPAGTIIRIPSLDNLIILDLQNGTS